MQRRGLILMVAVVALVTASIAVAVAAFIQRLPDIETADRPGLFRWLVQTNLRDESPEIQSRMLNRVEQELESGIDLTQCLSQIDAEQRARLLENVDHLAECWFFREANRYFAEPEATRLTMLRRQASRVQQLGILEQIAVLEGHGGAAATDRVNAVADNARRVDRWLTDIAPPERQRFSNYFSALRGALVWNNLQQWLSPQKPAAQKSSQQPAAPAA